MRLFLDFILASGLTVTGIVLFLIFKQQKKQVPQWIMVFFFVILFLIIASLYADIHNIDILWYVTYIPHDVARWVLGPLLYLYIKALFLKKENIFKGGVLHFIPAIICVLGVSAPTLWHILNESPKPNYLVFYAKHLPFFGNLSSGYTLFYLGISYHLLMRFRTKIKANYASLSGQDLSWVQHILIGGSIILGVDLGVQLYQYSIGVTSFNSGVLSIVALILFIGYLGYYGVHQSKILLPDFLLKENGNPPLYTTNERELLALKERLIYLLDTKKMYLDEGLTLIKLAEEIPTTDKKLSAFLNGYMKISFYDIVNHYRVSAVKEKIDSGTYENLSLIGIAYDCGFRSKASFNRIFKKETGFSPSQYRNRNKID
ncbi:helix-turn-helix domain-containing protein [Spongiimicrobium salis]|uniref:helix-turn-helix domain-containing protein n=1 Tax=Spongiimicrobium salis TaxID=1667022 RepID=UPI00374D6B9C